jgi:hypothetical protein
MAKFLTPGAPRITTNISTAVAGGGSDTDIRNLLLDTGIQAFRKMAGYIPGEMSLENEPQRMLKDWRSCPFRTDFSGYHYRWLQENYGDMPLSRFIGWPRIPWQADTGRVYPLCCQVSSNACGLSRRNRLTVGESVRLALNKR